MKLLFIYLFSDNNVGNVDMVHNLNLKIKHMIENYCDHEWENTCCGCNMGAILCDKCQVSLDEKI
jgi:hypothetical protein